MDNTIQSIKKCGSLNPMYGKRHDAETKKKISDTQKRRYAMIRKAINGNNNSDENQSIVEAQKLDLSELEQYEIKFNTIKPTLIFLSRLLDKEYISQIINDEINKLLFQSDKVGM